MVTDTISSCSQTPTGGFGSLIYIETLTDYFRGKTYPNGSPILERGIDTAHEIGHQFGISGDGTSDKIMNGKVTSVAVGEEKFIPAHLNIIRCRINSPGQ